MRRKSKNEGPEFGERRSVFDLLKEKYPDLQDGKPAKAAKAVEPATPVPAVEPLPVEPVPVEPVPVEPVPVEPVPVEPVPAEPVPVEPVPAEPEPVEPEPVEPEPAEPEPVEPELVEPEPVEPAVRALAQVAAVEPVAAREPEVSPEAVPAKARPKLAKGDGKAGKRALFWGSLGLGLFALLALLSSMKPNAAPAPSDTADTQAEVPTEAANADLEPERVVVLPPATAGTQPVKPQPVKPKPTKPEPAAAKPSAKPPAKPPVKPVAKTPPPEIRIEPEAPILPPIRIGGTQPEYPLAARAAGIEGKVVLFGVVGRDGKVRDARVVRSLSPPLDAAALSAFRTWHFQPATQKGKKVDFKYNAGIEFRINSPTEQVAEESSEEEGAAEDPAALAQGVTKPLAEGGDFTPPVRITMVWPQKPPGTQMVKGVVKLQLVVDALGLVQNVEVLEGLPQGVTEAAIEAVRQWKFRPARRNGEPVAVYHRVSLRF